MRSWIPIWYISKGLLTLARSHDYFTSASMGKLRGPAGNEFLPIIWSHARQGMRDIAVLEP